MALDVPVNPYSDDAPGNAGAGDAPTWLDALARAGYAARGVVYLLIGGLAVAAAFGGGGSTGGSRNALATLTDGPVERTLLGLVALGLVGYSVWRAVQAVLDPDHHGTDGKGLAVRIGMGVSAVSHLGLAIWAATAAVSGSASESGSASGGDGGGEGGGGLTAWVLGLPGGRWILGFVALCVLGAAIAFAVKAHTKKFEEHLRIDASKMNTIRPICMFGLYARAVVFALIAFFLAYASWTHDASQGGGVGRALATLRDQAYGPVLLGVVAAGLVAFGCYGIFQALYRKIDAPPSLK